MSALDLAARLRARGTALDVEAAGWIEDVCRSIARAASIVPEQSPEQIKVAERLKQEALDKGFYPRARKRSL